MGYLEPEYKHDVFVSYARVDNEPDVGVERGWVTTLVESLRKRVAKKLRPKPDFWRDYQLAKNRELTAEITDQLEASATLLMILSPAYLASEWCLYENERFWKAVDNRFRPESRVFLVEHDRLMDGTEPPAECRDLHPYRFWVTEPDRKAPRILGWPKPRPGAPEERPYYDRLDSLSLDLASELKRLKEGRAKAPPDPRSTVFLARVTDDLDYTRSDVERYLAQVGISCLPDKRYPLDDLDEFQRNVDEDLERSSRFVQLLSQYPGKRGYLKLQYERAVEAELPILQWHDPQLNPLDEKTVRDPDQRQLLQLPTVQAIAIEEFKQAVRDWRPPEAREPINAFVFVDSDRRDGALARQVCQVLEGFGAGYSLPLPLTDEEPSVQATREDLEKNLENCDALIIVYGQTQIKWVRDQLFQCLRAISKRDRERPLRALAIFEGPPAEPPKRDPNMKLPGLEIHTIHCTMGLDEEALRRFLDSLRT